MTEIHPRANEVFSGSNKGVRLDSHYLYGFVNGATPKEMSVVGVGDAEDISEVQVDSSLDYVNISQRALRDKLNRWRTVICSDVDYLTYIFRVLLSQSRHLDSIQKEFHQPVRKILSHGLFKDITDGSKPDREFLWAKAKDCFEQCPTSLTKFELTKKYNGICTYNAHILNWRGHLGELEMNTGFKEWISENMDRINALLKKVAERAERKQGCRFCHFPICRSHTFATTENIAFYLSKYRIGSSKKFYEHYVMAIIFSILRMELILHLSSLQNLAEKKQVFSDTKKEFFDKYRYNIDRYQQHLINSICLAIVDCLLAEKFGDKSEIEKVILYEFEELPT